MFINDIKNIKGSNSDIRKFALIICIALAVLGWFLGRHEKDYHTYFYGFSVIFLVVGLVLPVLLRPLYKGWMTIALLMGWVMTRLILGLLYYFVFAPIGLISKLTGKRFLDLDMERSDDSYWVAKNTSEIEKSHCERQF